MLATWRGVELTTPHLSKSGSGAIVIISTTAAVEAFAGPSPYGAIKAGLLNYSSNLSQALAASGVRVNAVSPGPIFFEGGAWEQIKTHMTDFYDATVASIPMGRMGTNYEIADTVAFLASPVRRLRRALTWWSTEALPSGCSSESSPPINTIMTPATTGVFYGGLPLLQICDQLVEFAEG